MLASYISQFYSLLPKIWSFTIFNSLLYLDKSKSRGGSDPKKESAVPKEPTAHIAAQTFTFKELANATKNFRPESLLGEGGFGRVYKGRLESTGQVSCNCLRLMSMVSHLKLVVVFGL